MDCTDSVCTANYYCKLTWSYYYYDIDWLEDNIVMLTGKGGYSNIKWRYVLTNKEVIRVCRL